MSLRDGAAGRARLGTLWTEQMRAPGVHLLGVLDAVNIGANNWSLVFISLSVRATRALAAISPPP